MEKTTAPVQELSLGEVHESVDTSKHKKKWSRFFAFIGPAYLVSVGYMDPGNWATDLQGGAQFGYTLIWVLLMSNLMALLLQGLSTRLGIVRRRDLAQANREVYPKVVNFCLYLLAEIAIAACDLAEVIGMAIGIQLLTGLPLVWGVSITILDTFLLFYLQKLGMRKLEAFIVVLIAIIALSFFAELFFARPDWDNVVKGFKPTLLNSQALYIAVGIIGATVMPHNLYLHSALVQTRKVKADDTSIRRALKFNLIDSAVALNIAFVVNACILILAASTFFTSGHTNVATIQDAHKLLEGMLGTKLAPVLFAVALIAAGQSSTITGTLAGQIVMEGYLKLRINPLLRRLLTRLLAIIPALLVVIIAGEEKVNDLLVLSQVILSLQLSFAIIPLIHFVSDKKTMGAYVIKPYVQVLAWIVATILVYLNVKLVTETVIEAFKEEGHLLLKAVIGLGAIAFVWLFVMMAILPVINRKKERKSIRLHSEEKRLQNLDIPQTNRIAIALDFSNLDEKLIAYALKQGQQHASYVLMHIVETVAANYSGEAADDYETRNDQQQLEDYAWQLTELGYDVKTALGYKDRVDEILRIVKTERADMLVLGAHRHKGLKDYVYGATVDQVRHRLTIPVLIVS
ncbi:iron/manganese transporter [Ilyomonas limi]|uniref:Divalent metal cation transporter MntH n=1 Tax=Ilyomonas limi TaxID=2575867 RepID=A0A4U3L7L3_9BACT|nr:Nramp family divalent metal transporter [Ilyomonas limi]TKK69816.1 iron/manganese transporter [Ilyomonas limi]